MEFFKTEAGKIISHGVHEHNSGLGGIRNNLYFMEKFLELGEKSGFTQEDYKRFFENIKTCAKKCEESIDYIYKEIKALEEQRQK